MDSAAPAGAPVGFARVGRLRTDDSFEKLLGLKVTGSASSPIASPAALSDEMLGTFRYLSGIRRTKQLIEAATARRLSGLLGRGLWNPAGWRPFFELDTGYRTQPANGLFRAPLGWKSDADPAGWRPFFLARRPNEGGFRAGLGRNADLGAAHRGPRLRRRFRRGQMGPRE